MQAKIGRFSGYIPDYDAFEILKKVLSNSFNKENDQFESSPSDLQKYFYDMKKRHPDLFIDIHFNYDPDFPFSKEVDRAFLRLHESGYVSRPNPSFYRYRITVNLEEKKTDEPTKLDQAIMEMAEEFQKRFRYQ